MFRFKVSYTQQHNNEKDASHYKIYKLCVGLLIPCRTAHVNND